jgi:hypothetical protein
VVAGVWEGWREGRCGSQERERFVLAGIGAGCFGAFGDGIGAWAGVEADEGPDPLERGLGFAEGCSLRC